MNDPTIAAVNEGVRRAVYDWQLEHREPCDDCVWKVDRGPTRTTITLFYACKKHGGTQ